METKPGGYNYKYLKPPKRRSAVPYNTLIVLGAILFLVGLAFYFREWQVEASPPANVPGPSQPIADQPSRPGSPPSQPAAQAAVREPPTSLSIPAIGVRTPVLKMGWNDVNQNGKVTSEWDIPANAAGWAINSAAPGQGSNIVLAGHNNIDGDVFLHLADLKAGEKVTLYVGDVPYSYVVQEKYVIREAGVPLEQQLANARWMDPTPDERVTLISCWPPTNNTFRVIVIARPGGD